MQGSQSIFHVEVPTQQPKVSRTRSEHRLVDKKRSLPPLPQAVTPPPEISYHYRHPVGSMIISKIRKALGDSVVERRLAPELLATLAPSPVKLAPLTPIRSTVSTTSPQRAQRTEPVPFAFPKRDALRAQVLAHQLETYLNAAEAMSKQEERFAAAAKMRRTAQTIVDEWKQYVATHPDTEADQEKLMRERADRRFRRAQDEAKSETMIALTESMSNERRWRVPKNTVAEVYSEPRMSCFTVAVLQAEQVVRELETKAIGKVLWVRIAEGWVGAQFAYKGVVRVQLVPEAAATETSVREFMLDARDHICDTIDKGLETCPLDRMISINDAKDLAAAAQRRREELRSLPDGHYELIRQTWLDMQNSVHLRRFLETEIVPEDGDEETSP